MPSLPLPTSTLFASAVVALSLTAACQPQPAPGSGGEQASTESSDKEAMSPNARFAEGEAKPNEFWWPEQVDLGPLRHNAAANPYGADFDYAEAHASVDHEQLKADMKALLHDSKDWWPADYGNYGPFFIRMSWHSAGTYRVSDGRGGADGGQQRFEPLNSWPDNANLDKARRLLWPLKKKYGNAVSWADLMVLAGTVGMEDMGFDTLGFAYGRTDDWEPELVYWGPEAEMLANKRYHGERDLDKPLAAVQMGLIYVNPEGPDGNPDPKAAAHDIRTTFGRMAMNDEETVALIAGGHSFGKAHGAHDPGKCLDVEPAAAGLHAQGMGWTNSCGKGHSEDTVTSGLEGAWTPTPANWSHGYFANLFSFEWEKTESPAGATQWKPVDGKGADMVPDAHIEGKRHAPMMFTTDLSLREDPAYAAISKRFKDDPKAFEEAFAEAWFKLTHRDLGPKTRYLGPEVPEQDFPWQDPLPEVDHALITDGDAATLKGRILDSGLTVPELVRVSWAAASTYRDSDMRGGVNGARIRLAPQKDWDVNDPAEVSKVIGQLESIQTAFNESAGGGKKISLADLIVLGGAAAIEKAAKDAGHDITVPFTPGRVDASQEQTDVESFGYLKPSADGFRNYYTEADYRRPTDALIDKADLLDLTVPEMTALVGGLRVLDANAGGVDHGVLTDKPGTLSNDFFVNLYDMSTDWKPSSDAYVFTGTGEDGAERWTATEVDLVFGSNAELRAVGEVYAYDEAEFTQDFVDAWVKVMQADRFDLHR